LQRIKALLQEVLDVVVYYDDRELQGCKESLKVGKMEGLFFLR
jgi:hypothetical protein